MRRSIIRCGSRRRIGIHHRTDDMSRLLDEATEDIDLLLLVHDDLIELVDRLLKVRDYKLKMLEPRILVHIGHSG